jgi:pyruvate/2-oxoglutarate dehydrogenase complex dihydrolipoamide acyltransferase (E2) component
MPIDIIMPNFGLSIAEGTIESWLKKEGDRVEKGELLAVIQTEKVAVEIPAEASGVLLKILHPAGAVVKVGESIGLIGQPGEAAGQTIPKAEAFLPQSRPTSVGPLPERGDLKVSPLAMKMAMDKGVDIREVAARFPGKKIGKSEILSYLETAKGALPEKTLEEKGVSKIPEDEIKPLSGALKAMAEHMAHSASVAARVTTMAEVDMTELVKIRGALKESFKEEFKVSLTFVPFVVKAICAGLKKYLTLNASLLGQGIVIHRRMNVGMAVDAGESLLVPVIKDAQNKGIVDLSQEIQSLSTRAREGKLMLNDIQGGTFTLTNAGVYGGLLATPIIHQPQSAILWMGKVMEMPVVREGQIVIRSMMYLCLSYDHRIIMGAQAVQFLQIVKRNLENPVLLLLV